MELRKQLQALEIAFNNILRQMWRLPRMCHTRILNSFNSGNAEYFQKTD